MTYNIYSSILRQVSHLTTDHNTKWCSSAAPALKLGDLMEKSILRYANNLTADHTPGLGTYNQARDSEPVALPVLREKVEKAAYSLKEGKSPGF